MTVRLQVIVRAPAAEDDPRGHNRQAVFDLDCEIDTGVADEVCSLVMEHLAKRNQQAATAHG